MRYGFADLTLDSGRCALEQAGQAVRIRPKVFDVLVYLIEHHERPVSKNELLQALWPQRCVSESTLSTCLKELRQALGDSGRRQRVIQTLPKRGYRFIAPLEIEENRQTNSDAAVKTHAKNTSSEQRTAAANGSKRRALTPFFGRSQELALLHERLRHACEGQGQVVAIIGEPGIGKSRLLQEFRTGLSDPAIDFYQAQCFAHGRSTPYLPVLSLLRQFCAIGEDAAPGDIVARLRRYLASARIGDSDALPLLLRLFDIPYDIVPLKRFSPQAQRQRTLRLLRRLALLTAKPRVIVIEDLHWIDAASQEWLTSLITQIAGASLLLLAYRPNYIPPWLGRGHITQLVLPPLGRNNSLTAPDVMRPACAWRGADPAPQNLR